MKRTTATKHLATIVSRLEQCNGIFQTPKAYFSRHIIKKAWVFGSYIKGAENPNDLDILIETSPDQTSPIINQEDIYFSESGQDRAIIILRHRMHKISVHSLCMDGKFGDIAKTKQLIFTQQK